jgi:Xaa-Pro aminopeptidase
MASSRLAKLRDSLQARRIDAGLVTDIHNIFYLSGFTGSTAALIVTPDRCYVLVDPRYTLQAERECTNIEIVGYRDKHLLDAAAQAINHIKPDTVGIEADNLTLADWRRLRGKVERATRIRSTSGLVQGLRRVKDRDEITLIKAACAIADEVFAALIKRIKAGMTEKEVALLVDCEVRSRGGDMPAFETIAACGPNSACPHAQPTNAVLKPGQFLKIDYGSRRAGYNSDITRTVCIGEPDAKQREVYSVVLEAQLRAIEAIRPGRTGKEIDAIARDVIAAKGFGDHFGHGLGHALGIEVHDGPGLSQNSNLVLEPGNVLTVEPGIYIEGWGGVRIEDDVVVTDTGVEVLTHATKELTVI